MNFEHNSEKYNIIKSPLWDLMLSTNDCYPGCGCDEDYFDMTLERIKKWVEAHDELTVILQIDQLLSNDNIDVGDIQIQTNIPFQSEEEFKECLLEWKKLIKES
ncbi:MAG: hypothetical protein CEE42_13640 [Promethearchaeota archaeon Loki_b31]|nr:MAG: hypothetical protein CEE42_13640 [Candidatus Lokiarchaeota archaeon Loki_b31]